MRSYGHIVPSAHREGMDLYDGFVRDLNSQQGSTDGGTSASKMALQRSS